MSETILQDVRKDGAELLPRLGETIGATARASVVYGEPVIREGITVVPVAKVRYGYGGGSGRRTPGARGAQEAASEEVGTGGGAGVQAAPLGYIEIRDGRSRFRRIRDPAATTARIAVVGGLGLLALASLRRLLRG